jgi:hypothetical protein
MPLASQIAAEENIAKAKVAPSLAESGPSGSTSTLPLSPKKEVEK